MKNIICDMAGFTKLTQTKYLTSPRLVRLYRYIIRWLSLTYHSYSISNFSLVHTQVFLQAHQPILCQSRMLHIRNLLFYSSYFFIIQKSSKIARQCLLSHQCPLKITLHPYGFKKSLWKAKSRTDSDFCNVALCCFLSFFWCVNFISLWGLIRQF